MAARDRLVVPRQETDDLEDDAATWRRPWDARCGWRWRSSAARLSWRAASSTDRSDRRAWSQPHLRRLVQPWTRPGAARGEAAARRCLRDASGTANRYGREGSANPASWDATAEVELLWLRW